MSINVQVKTNAEEIVSSKFARTLQVINGYTQEAYGDLAVNQSYSARAVHNRFADVQRALLSDLAALAKDITIVPEA